MDKVQLNEEEINLIREGKSVQAAKAAHKRLNKGQHVFKNRILLKDIIPVVQNVVFSLDRTNQIFVQQLQEIRVDILSQIKRVRDIISHTSSNNQKEAEIWLRQIENAIEPKNPIKNQVSMFATTQKIQREYYVYNKSDNT